MPSFLYGVSTVILAIIAIELYILIKEIAKFPREISAKSDKKDGQTITVNVATVPVPEGGQPAVTVREEKREGSALQQENSEGTEKKGTAESRIQHFPSPLAGKVTTSGQIIIKCPKCQAENSSFRTECFNCGASLK